MKIACPVPMERCSGGVYIADDVREKVTKCHEDYSEVRACQRRYLAFTSYRQIGSAEFLSPNGSVLVLSRKLGLVVKLGKSGAVGGGTGKRVEARGIKIW